MIDLTQEQQLIVKNILSHYVPEFDVWAFGSRVNGNSKTYSDLDLVIKTEKPLSLLTLSNLTEAFSLSDLPWKVDVLDWSSINDNFREIIKARYIELQKGKLKSSLVK
ncbi:nucleotidyltransferase domain-containing protein [Otariodibacter sp.]|uniref:nucleotidyltransferase family protein n=1 Tax=Otariodibacter sp. TaxID=3030919 RepID=UPI002621B085|nr:nucleotidyltransferase domain-containing protein [Otariodibacter sp.]